MAKTVKRILSGAVCLALLFTMLCLSGCKSYIGSSKQTLEKLNIQAQIMNNGDMNVVETWRVNLKDRGKAYHKIYKTFGMLPEDKDFVDNFSVYDEDNHMEYQKVTDTDPDQLSAKDAQNTCYLYRTSYQQELGLFMPDIKEGVRTFTFRYTVKRQVSSYNDTSVFYYKFISTNFTVPITDMTCTIKLPDGAKKEDLHAWLHCTAKSNLAIDSGNQITITASEIPVSTQVETRICMPPKLFSPSTVISKGNWLEGIINQEQKWASEWQEQQYEKYIRVLIDLAGGIILILLSVLLFLYNKRKKKRFQVDVPKYTRDIPPGNTPAGIANLYYYYDDGVTERKRGYVFSATFLELARKGYLTFSEQNEKIGITVSLTEKCKSESRADLSPNESAFLTLISPAAENKSHSFTMAQFEEYAKNNYELIDDGFDDFLEKSSEEIAQRGYFQTKNVVSGLISKFGIGFVIVGAIMLFGMSLLFIPIGAIIGGIIMIVSGWGQQPLSEIGEREYKVWHGLKKYMLEFSRMKEYSVPQLELWEEYLVYATMMGISKQVCEQLKLVYPEINDQSYRDTNWATSSYMYFMFDFQTDTENGSWDTDLGTILSDRISSIHDEVDTLMNPPSSDSGGGFGGDGGGGGGFDGGGGGFDGGGGGID